MGNTFKSTFNATKSAFSRLFSFEQFDGGVEGIINNFRYSDTLRSSGQPTKKQFSSISKAGYDVVINLAPYDIIEAPLKGEPEIVATLGLEYIHIPVNFLNPTQEDFDKFVDVMQRSSEKKVWVHCAVGMRASAFIYRYRCTILGEEEQTALWDLREIWEPFGVWKRFTFGEKLLAS